MQTQTHHLTVGFLYMLILICGRSRAGKTTYAKRFDNVLHLDDYGYFKTAYDGLLKDVEAISGDVVIDGIFDTAEKRTALLDAYHGGGARICIWIDTPTDAIQERKRIKTPPMQFVEPTTKEGWDRVERINNDLFQT